MTVGCGDLGVRDVERWGERSESAKERMGRKKPIALARSLVVKAGRGREGCGAVAGEKGKASGRMYFFNMIL